MTIHKMGWVVAATVVGAVVGVGFHAPAEKTGNVDLVKVSSECDLVKKQLELFKNQFTLRQGLIDFLKTNPVITPEKAAKFRELTLKEVVTAADKAEIEKIKEDAAETTRKLIALQQKQNLTQAERDQINDMTNRKEAMLAMLEQRWVQEFREEMDKKQQDLRVALNGKILDAVTKVAKEQGYSIVFSRETALYSANDITADTIKAVNKMSL